MGIDGDSVVGIGFVRNAPIEHIDIEAEVQQACDEAVSFLKIEQIGPADQPDIKDDRGGKPEMKLTDVCRGANSSMVGSKVIPTINHHYSDKYSP